MENNSNISVIMRTKNEERWIGHSIQSVLELITKPEIIVIDNMSEDRTIEIVKHFQQDPELNSEKSSNYTSIKIHYIKDYSPGKSLNLGVKCSSNDYILTLSSHCVVKKFNKAKHIKDLENHLCIFGNQIPIWEGKKINKRYIWSHFVNAEVVNMFSEMENRYFLHNGIAFYKKETLINYPFDPHLVGKEDRYWANNIIQKKHNILYDPLMEAEHHYTIHGNTWKGLG